MAYIRIVGKMTGQKTGKYCKEVIVDGLPSLCATSKDTQQTLALLPEACPYYAEYYTS